MNLYALGHLGKQVQPDNQILANGISPARIVRSSLDPALKFMPASKDKETESTKAIVVRRLKEGVSVKDIKLAIERVIALDYDPNPSFAVRDNLDAGIDRIQSDREQTRQSQERLARVSARESAK